MTFSSLPTEILYKIASFSLLEDEVDAAIDFFRHTCGRNSVDTLQVKCEHAPLASLSSVDVRMRAICLPILFSHISIRLPDTYRGNLDLWGDSDSSNDSDSSSDSDSCGDSEDIQLRALERMLTCRPHISQSIQSVSMRSSKPALLKNQDLVVLARILGALPNVTSLYGISYTSEAFVDAVNDHPSLTFVDLSETWFPFNIPDNAHDDYYRKFTLKSAISRLSHFEAAMRLGLSIKSLKLDFPSTKMHDAVKFRSPSLTSLEINITSRRITGTSDTFMDWLSPFVSSCVNLRRILFRVVIEDVGLLVVGRHLSDLYRGLSPLLGELGNVHAASPENAGTIVSSFTIRRRIGNTTGSFLESRPANDLWSNEWTISSLRLATGYHDLISPGMISAKASSAMPDLASLIFARENLHGRHTLSQDVETGSDILRGFPCLRYVWFEGYQIVTLDQDGDYKAQYAQGLRRFAIGLKNTVPSLVFIHGRDNRGSLDIFYACGFKSRHTEDGSGYEIVIEVDVNQKS